MNKKIFDLWQRFAHFDAQQAKYLAAAGVVVVLVLAWVLTSPLFELGGKFFRRDKRVSLKT